MSPDTTSVLDPPCRPASRTCLAVSLSSPSLLPVRVRFHPLRPKAMHVALPIPDEAPVLDSQEARDELAGD